MTSHGAFELDEGPRVLLGLALHYHASIGRILWYNLGLDGLYLAYEVAQVKDASSDDLVFTVQLELVLITFILIIPSWHEASGKPEHCLLLRESNDWILLVDRSFLCLNILGASVPLDIKLLRLVRLYRCFDYAHLYVHFYFCSWHIC